jgi:hypothetical protein
MIAAIVLTYLVVCVEDDELVVFVDGGYVVPPRLEARGVVDDATVNTTVIVWLDHGVCALAGDVVDLLGQVAQVKRVKVAGEGVGCQALHDCCKLSVSCGCMEA